jgi:ParB/RepB/Spo0J family partition protein
MAELKNIPVSDITPQKEGLRSVNTDSEGFKDLCRSIKDNGVLNAINVRPDGSGGYILIDGLHRFTATCTVGLETIPAQVLDVNEVEALELQIEGNLQKIETKPIEYTRQLMRIMLQHPERSIEDQAKRLHKSPGWLRDRLSLNKFEGRAAELIEAGTMKVSNAYGLAKLAEVAPEEVDDWLERACEMAPEDFLPEVTKRTQEVKKAKAAGRQAPAEATGPALKLRKLGDIKLEYQRVKASAAVRKDDVHVAGQLAAFEYVLSQDSATIAEWKKTQEEVKKQKEERQREKEAKKAADAQGESKLSLQDILKVKSK